jgi:NADPH:quinone reductase-like Zn-dependent oxidoreductase
MSARLPLPHIPGVDAAGVVDISEVPGASVGDEVFGTVPIARLGGASAEFAVLQFWAPKPAAMPWEQAGAAGSSIETATRVLDLLDLRDAMTIVIDGAAGGVGSVAVQLAVARGARVGGPGGPPITTSSPGWVPFPWRTAQVLPTA